MNKQNFLTLTLIISGLALNPVMADLVVDRAVSTQNINHSISSNIASILYNRGLEEETAEELAAVVVDEEDEIFLAMLLQTLDAKKIVSREEVLDHLSSVALHKQKIDFKSYDNLVGMVSKIKQKSLDENTLKQLSYLAKVNKQLFV
jgi:hypothetical protein